MSASEVLEGVRRVRQFTTVQDYLVRFNRTVAECPSLSAEFKAKIFVNYSRAEIGDLVDVSRPRNVKEAIGGAVRIEAEQAERNRDRRAGRGEPAPGQPRGVRPEARRPHGEDVQAGMRHSGYGGVSASATSPGPPADVRVRGRSKTADAAALPFASQL